jgi:hypothetical protein
MTGGLSDPKLAFTPGALLRSSGRVIDALNIDDVRWPLAGVKVTRAGVDGRLQAILRAHENAMGDFVLHLDGQARDFYQTMGCGNGVTGGRVTLPYERPLGCQRTRRMA